MYVRATPEGEIRSGFNAYIVAYNMLADIELPTLRPQAIISGVKFAILL